MKLWKVRFTKEENSFADKFNSSTDVDCRMWAQDIRGSIAHAKMPGRQGIIPDDDSLKIVQGLEKILRDMEAGLSLFEPGDEDIHMAVERILTERIGDVGKKLHTARSRNDQVAVDFRLYPKDVVSEIMEKLKALLAVILKTAEENTDTIMPGFTHLQKAQPVMLAQHMLAYYNMFFRDSDRFSDCLRRTDYMPLGSGALAGTTYSTDRNFMMNELGFSGLCPNSMDAVSDRDFALEFLSCCSICMMHLSRFCEELILWNTPDFGFIEMDDAFATGSSIMPQKKNPDMAELVRGKTGRVYGDLMSLLTVMKGLPLAYNKDFQEDKESLFDAIDTWKASIQIFANMLDKTEFRMDQIEKQFAKGFLNATDIAEHFAKQGIPFREAHSIVGRMVKVCETRNCDFEDLTEEELQAIDSRVTRDSLGDISMKACVDARVSFGGTAPTEVRRQIAVGTEWLKTVPQL